MIIINNWENELRMTCQENQMNKPTASTDADAGGKAGGGGFLPTKTRRFRN